MLLQQVSVSFESSLALFESLLPIVRLIFLLFLQSLLSLESFLTQDFLHRSAVLDFGFALLLVEIVDCVKFT